MTRKPMTQTEALKRVRKANKQVQDRLRKATNKGGSD